MHGVLLEPHAEVRGTEVRDVAVRSDGGAWVADTWEALGGEPRDPGEYEVRVRVDGGSGGASAQLPPCAGRGHVSIDGRDVPAPPGPVVVPLAAGAHDIVITVGVSRYERRIACGELPRVGPARTTTEGLGVLAFDSPHGSAGGGRAVVYVPPGHDAAKPGAMLVGLHPWNGSVWTYAAYAELLRAADARDVVLLMPSGLGNSLYVADAEDEVMRAIDALAEVVAVDPRRVSLWGASMGGAGATTVGFHHPDRFAGVTSFFGDSRYDLSTYVRGLLHDEHGAHLVNALDVVDNARWLPVWLVHGEDDHTSPIRQSEILADAMRARGFTVAFDRVPGLGHAGVLVAKYVGAVVERAATLQSAASPARVTYRSVRPWDTGAYGVHIQRASDTGDAFIDLERVGSEVRVNRQENVRRWWVDPGALGVESRRAAEPQRGGCGRSGLHDSLEAAPQMAFAEVDQDAEAQAGCLQVGDHLGGVNRGGRRKRLQLHDDPAVDDEVHAAIPDGYALVLNDHRYLPGERDSAPSEFLAEGVFVNALAEGRSQVSVHLDGRIEQDARQRIVAVTRLHAPLSVVTVHSCFSTTNPLRLCGSAALHASPATRGSP
jgi:pimeloyl-ACP methyl ester carboxylesterase